MTALCSFISKHLRGNKGNQPEMICVVQLQAGSVYHEDNQIIKWVTTIS